MLKNALRDLGQRIRDRLKHEGVSSTRRLFQETGYGTDALQHMKGGQAGDVGLMKVVHVSLIAGVSPTEIGRIIEERLFTPLIIGKDVAKEIGLDGYPDAWPDLSRLSLIVDTILDVAPYTGKTTPTTRESVGELAQAYYQEMVERDPSISPIELRRKITADLMGIDLPPPRR